MASGGLILAALLGITAVEPVASPAPSPARGAGIPIAAAALAAAGVVGVAGGAFFGWRARQVEAEIESQKGLAPNELYQERMDRGRRAETLQWISYGVGAAALAGSAAVYLITRPRASEGAPVAASVAATPFGAGLTIAGRF